MRLRIPGFRILLLSAVIPLGALSGVAAGTTVELTPSKDNSLYEDWPDRSNGAGDGVFVGQTLHTEALRRGLIAFDLSSIPSGSTINSVTLTLEATIAWPVSSLTGLHRATADWGEAGSSSSPGGEGAPAQPGDATWSHRFWDTTVWAAPGGDFVAAPSATQTVGADGTYAWTGPGLVADVQFWLGNPAQNFGWLLIGDEVVLQTAKKFGSRESLVPPRLAVDYTPPVPGPAGWMQAALALAMAAVAAAFVHRRRRVGEV